MRDVRHILRGIAAGVAAVFLLVSCDSKQEFIKHSTKLNFSVSDRGAASVTITVRPDEDRVYYYYTVIEKEIFDTMRITPMQYLDSCMREQKKWYDISDTLFWQSPYNCSFSDYALKYATTTQKFSGLSVATEYLAMGLCLDPDSNSPLGEVQTFQFSTLDIHEIEESDMKFDFMVVTKGEREVRLYIKPQYVSKSGINKSLYLSWGIMSKKEIDENFSGDVRNCVIWLTTTVEGQIILDNCLYSDISEVFYDMDLLPENFFVPGEEYVAWACPYALDYEDNIYTLTFTYDIDLTINYTHDQRP